MSLSTALNAAPDRGTMAYTLTGASAPVIGGAIVSVSHNNPKRGKPEDFLTCQDGRMQQSIPLRAVAAAIAADVLPLADIVAVLVNVGRIGEETAAAILAPVETETEGTPA